MMQTIKNFGPGRAKALLATVALTAAAVPAVAEAAAPSPWAFPIDENTLRFGNSSPLSDCHHGACGSVSDSFWAIDLFHGDGESIFAVRSGYVHKSGNFGGIGESIRHGYSSDHTYVDSYQYGHGESGTREYSDGQFMQKGALLMKMGQTGSGSGGTTHLHHEVRYLANVDSWSGSHTSYCSKYMMNQLLAGNGNTIGSNSVFKVAYNSDANVVYDSDCN